MFGCWILDLGSWDMAPGLALWRWDKALAGTRMNTSLSIAHINSLQI